MNKDQRSKSEKNEYIQLIEHHIFDPGFHDDFVKICRELSNPDEFILSIEKRIKAIVLDNKQLNFFLYWAMSQERSTTVGAYRPIESAFYRLEELQRQIWGGYLAQDFHERSIRRLFHDFTGGYGDIPIYPLARAIVKALYLFKDLDDENSIFKGLAKSDDLSTRNEFCDYLRANTIMVECINLDIEISKSLRTRVLNDLLDEAAIAAEKNHVYI